MFPAFGRPFVKALSPRHHCASRRFLLPAMTAWALEIRFEQIGRDCHSNKFRFEKIECVFRRLYALCYFSAPLLPNTNIAFWLRNSSEAVGPAVGKGPDNRGRGDPLKKRILPDRSPLLFPLSGRHARSTTLLISERTSRTILPTQLPASPRLFWAPSNVWRSFRILVGQAELLVRENWSYLARST